MAQKTQLPDGLVERERYQELIESDFFKEIEAFSNDFISKVGPLIQSYNIRWVPDPFHQWSRQWEYPYIISRIQALDKEATIVDLGAGVAFLPYYLKNRLGFTHIKAVDYDRSLKNLYKKVNDQMGYAITFQDGDMRNLHNISDKSVDFAYSVSVLEHTDSYPTVLKEIYRILKPGGQLCLTFDISLDGLDDIPLHRAHELVNSLEEIFGTDTGIDLDIAISNPQLVTSGYMAKQNKLLMPWKYPIVNVVKHFIDHGKPGKMYKNLTFCCLTVTKKAK